MGGGISVVRTRKIFRTLLSDSSPANLLPVPSKQSTNCFGVEEGGTCKAIIAGGGRDPGGMPRYIPKRKTGARQLQRVGGWDRMRIDRVIHRSPGYVKLWWASHSNQTRVSPPSPMNHALWKGLIR